LKIRDFTFPNPDLPGFWKSKSGNFSKWTWPIFQQPLHSNIQCVQLVHLPDRPGSFLSMPPKKRSLMAVFAQGNAGVLAVLFNVVSI
jgi:hypothetical protein